MISSCLAIILVILIMEAKAKKQTLLNTLIPLPKQRTILTTLTDMLSSAIGCIFTHQIIYLNQPTRSQKSASLLRRFINNFRSTRRPTQESIILFSLKIITDFYTYQQNLIYSQAEKGALTGLMFYLINRPLIQVQHIREELARQERRIGMTQAITLIHRIDGLRGFYKFQNLLGPLNSIIYRSIQFGLHQTLLKINDHFLTTFLISPLISTAAATLGTLHLQKCRNIYVNIHHYRQALVLTGQRRMFFKSVTKEVLESKREIFRVNNFQLSALGYSLFKNWLLFSVFLASQNWISLSQHAQYSFIKDLYNAP